MEIQPGKFYRTRSGGKVYILENSPFRSGLVYERLVNGYVEGRQSLFTWSALTGFHKGVGALDIVGEWRERKSGKLWLNIYDNGATIPLSLQEAERDAMTGRIMSCPVDWIEPW